MMGTYKQACHLGVRMPTFPLQLARFLDLLIIVGDVMLYNHLANFSTVRKGTCADLPDGGLRCVSWNTRGLVGSISSSQVSTERKHQHLKRPIDKNDVITFEETHGKDEFL